MRWPFRRDRGKSGPAPSTPERPPAPDAERPGPSAPPVPAGGAGPVHRQRGRQWLTLPPLPVVVRSTAPLVSGPAPVVPALPGHRGVSGPPVAPAVGRVDGLVTVVPHQLEPAPVTPPRPAPAPLPEPERPLVHRRRARAGQPVAEPAAMVEATGGFVGAAREPAVPYRAPGWLRYVPEWLSQNTPADPEPAPQPARPKPLPPPTKIVETPTVAPTTAPGPAALTPPPAARRPNLGQSRRLGLGAPLKPPLDPPADQQEPPPAQARPALVPPPAPVAPTGTVPAEQSAQPPPPEPEPPPRPRTRPADPEPVASTPTPPVPPVSTPVRPTPVTVPVALPVTVPLTYRSVPGRPRPRQQPRPEPRQRPRAVTPLTGYVPPDLATALRGPHQVDLSSVPVHRGPEVSVEARSLGARAFTRGGEVFLPAEAGPLDTPAARGLLAHELVHAVQQRTLGPSLPAPHTPAGLALEAEAVAVEQAHSGHAGHAHAEPAPLVHPSLTQVIGQAARTVGVQLAPMHTPVLPTMSAAPSQPVAPPVAAEPPAAPLTEPLREEIDLLAESTAIRTIEEWTAPVTEPAEPAEPDPFATGFPLGHSPQDQAMAEQILQVVNVERSVAGRPALTTLDAETIELIRRTVAEQTQDNAVRTMVVAQAAAANGNGAGPAGGPAGQPARRPEPETAPPPAAVVPAPAPPPAQLARLEPDDTPIELDRIDLEQLTARLYDRLRSRIRMELLIDRERAGLLTDFR